MKLAGRYVLCDEDTLTKAVVHRYSRHNRSAAIRDFRHAARHEHPWFHVLTLFDQIEGRVIARSTEWWWQPVEVETDEAAKQGILARMRGRLSGKDTASARRDAVCDLIELGHTEPEAWSLVFKAMPIEAADEMEAAE